MLSNADVLASQNDSQALTLTAEEVWPRYDEDEVAAAVSCLRSGKVNQWTGSKVVEFQDAFAAYVGSGQGIALANGSLALELALKAFGIGPGDEVIVTPRSFVASAFCVMLVGATPVFAEVDRDSGNITAETIRAVLTPRTKAIIPVHLAGWPADMPAIMALAREAGIYVIEDCAQAHGAEIDGQPVGSFGDAAAFSFCQDKIITTGGEGGMVMFKDEKAYEWAWSFKDHGKNRSKITRRPTNAGFSWLHDSVGTNWRMLEISAAIGLRQLKKLNEWRELRTRNAKIWSDALACVPGVRIPATPAGSRHAFYKFYAFVEQESVRNDILAAAAELGVRAFSGSCSEMYLESAFGHLHVPRLPVARELGETSLMFEVHPTLDAQRLKVRAKTVAGIIIESK